LKIPGIRIIATSALLWPLALQAAGPADATLEARVTFVSAGNVYLDAGSESGLFEGDGLDLMRGDSLVARVRVRYLASNHASCEIIERIAPPKSGDRAIRTSAVPPGTAPPPTRPATTAPEPPARAPAAALRRDGGVRGRVGVQYSALDARSEIGSDYVQPAFTLDIAGNRLGGSGWGFEADLRARRTYRDLPDGSSPSKSRNRVYALALFWADPLDRWRLSAGRQVSPDLSAVNLFDGLFVRREGRRWGFGAFAGTQPDPRDHAYSSSVKEAGAYWKYDARGPGAAGWSITSGLVGSYAEGELNREYLFARLLLGGRRTYASIAQEIDINRGWKADAGEPVFAPTNTFAFARREVFRTTSLEAGFDNRRHVRFYRDRTTPETDFDDSYRQGVWIGATQKFGGSSRLSVRASTRSGDVRSLTAAARTSLARFRGFELGARTTRYENGIADGWLHSLTAGIPVTRSLRFDLTRGFRREETVRSPGEKRSFDWISAETGITIARRWRLFASGEVNRGEGEDHRVVYSGAQYRF